MEKLEEKLKEEIWKPKEPEYMPPKRYEKQIKLTEDEKYW